MFNSQTTYKKCVSQFVNSLLAVERKLSLAAANFYLTNIGGARSTIG